MIFDEAKNIEVGQDKKVFKIITATVPGQHWLQVRNLLYLLNKSRNLYITFYRKKRKFGQR